MLQNLFDKRIIKENKVYLLINDCADILELPVEEFTKYCKAPVSIFNTNDAISESDYNHILLDYFPDKLDGIQFTRVETLEDKKSAIYKLYPLKMLFAKDIFINKAALNNMSVEEYIEKIDYLKEIDDEKERIQLKSSIGRQIEEYKKNFKNNMPSKAILDKYGLDVQVLSILNNGVNLMTFLVGDGVFYSLDPEYAADDDWGESSINKEGVITIPSFQYPSGKYEIKRNSGRDFRKFSVMENIVHVIKNVIPKDEWVDYLEFTADGINVSLNKNFIMKLINPSYNPGEYFIEGIPEVEETIYLTGEAD